MVKCGAPTTEIGCPVFRTEISIQMVTHALMEVQMVKRVAMIFGVVFILVGLLGFTVSGGMAMGDPTHPSMLLGWFPVNLLHNVVHILFGIWGIMAARAFASAQTFCKLGGFIYLCLALLGLVVPTTFGLIPIGGNDVFLHTVLGVLLGVGRLRLEGRDRDGHSVSGWTGGPVDRETRDSEPEIRWTGKGLVHLFLFSVSALPVHRSTGQPFSRPTQSSADAASQPDHRRHVVRALPARRARTTREDPGRAREVRANRLGRARVRSEQDERRRHRGGDRRRGLHRLRRRLNQAGRLSRT